MLYDISRLSDSHGLPDKGHGRTRRHKVQSGFTARALGALTRLLTLTNFWSSDRVSGRKWLELGSTAPESKDRGLQPPSLLRVHKVMCLRLARRVHGNHVVVQGPHGYSSLSCRFVVACAMHDQVDYLGSEHTSLLIDDPYRLNVALSTFSTSTSLYARFGNCEWHSL